ncbi:Tox-REase-5 domain-containing protein [Cronobacter sakazakii]
MEKYKYCGVSFDGWKDKSCQFWEAKARYDQFFRDDGTKKIGGEEITVLSIKLDAINQLRLLINY